MIGYIRLAIVLLPGFMVFKAAAQNQTITNGAPTTPVNFTGAGCRYNWTNDNPGIGLAASGMGNIASFKAINTGTTPITATITATPVAAGYAYIPNESDGTVSAIDLSKDTVIATIPVGQFPRGVEITPDGSKVYVTNAGSRTISVISTASNAVTATIPLVNFNTGAGYVRTDLDYVPITGLPGNMVMSPDGKSVYVANSGIAYDIETEDNSGNITGTTHIYVIYVIDIATGNVSMISLGKNPAGLCFNRDGTLLYVSSGDSNIVVINVKQTASACPIVISGSTSGSTSATLNDAGVADIVAVITEPTAPNTFNTGVNGTYAMVLSPDGSRLYITNNNSGTVTVINTVTNAIMATISVGEQPTNICISPDGSKVYVANGSCAAGASNTCPNSVSVISTATNTVVQTYNSLFDLPTVLSLSPDGKLLYVDNVHSDNLTVIDVTSTVNRAVGYINIGGTPGFNGGGRSSNFIAPGSCNGSPVTFTITVNPTPPTISTSGMPSALSTNYGTASASTQFYVSGAKMTTGILVKPPAGFEVSLDNLTFSSTVTVGGVGTIEPTPVYVRLAAKSAAGTYSGNVTLSSEGADTVSESLLVGTISAAKLTIVPNDQTRVYGADNPVLTLSYNGFVNGDDSTKLTKRPVIATTATTNSPVGTYPITVTGALDANYTITYLPGTLTINPANQTITFAALPDKILGDADFALSASSSSGLPVTYKSTDPTIAAIVNGDQVHLIKAGKVTITASQGGSNNFNPAPDVSQSFTIIPIPNIIANGPTTFFTGGSVVLTASSGPDYNYIWTKDGKDISGETGVSYTAIESGSYTVSIISGSHRITSTSITINSVFNLPPANFKLTINSATCRGSSDGSVIIAAAQTLNYTATITGNGLNTAYSFTNAQNISGLAAGTHSVCITVAGQSDYQQCFNIVITQPADLSVYTVVSDAENTVNLSLNGGAQYNITLNGVFYTTKENTISLPLQAGDNDLIVKTDKLCQGTVEKHINISSQIIPFPDPFQNTISLNLGVNVLNNITIEVYNLSFSKLYYSKMFGNHSGVLQIDLSSLQNGVYALMLISDEIEKTFKILKQ